MAKQFDETFQSKSRKPDVSKAVPADADCAKILKSQKNKIIYLFQDEVRKQVPGAFDKDSSVIINSLPKFLDLLSEALACGAKVEEAYEISKICEVHGKQRASLSNYTLEQVLFEYAILRRILLSVLREGAEITVEESDVIHEAIQEGMIQAGSEFTKTHTKVREQFESEIKARLAELNAVKIKGAVAVNMDVTEARKVQQTLSAKNKELDRFAAIAAHDLKSPLNSITQFTELLADQYRGRFDEEADQYFDFIVNAGRRMKDLIDNLLEFSRAGVIDKEKLVPINTLEVISAVRKNLLAEIERTDARITFNANLPKIMGNEFQVTQLFQNLIANAIKFHKPHQPPLVHISFSDVGKCWRFKVEDQGIGMDPKKSGKIFEIFNKIHGPTQHEGSGIGLAVCKRIIEAHGGQIDFESTPEVGTAFSFTLPKAPA